MLMHVEQCSGTGDLIQNNEVVRQVRYDIRILQATLGDSGLPVPGTRTLTGCIDFDASRDRRDLVGAVLTLKLEDGRHLGIKLTGEDGGISEGQHGHGACLCC